MTYIQLASLIFNKMTPEQQNAEITDSNIVSTWECDECGETSDVNPNWYGDNGTPSCCDRDMKYVKTEIII